MWKAIVAGTAALAIGGTSLVYAQQRFGRPDGFPGFQQGLRGLPGRDGTRGGERFRPSADDQRAFAEARLAGLKAGLMLSADQEKNWPAFEQAGRELAKLRVDRLSARAAQRGGSGAANPGVGNSGAAEDPIQRLRDRGTVMAETGAALKKLADATDPLYKSLDDSQKRRFAMLSRMGREGGFRGEDGFRGRDGGFRGGEGFRGRGGGFGRDDGPRLRGRDDYARGFYDYGRGYFGPPRSEVDPRDFGPRDFGPRGYERGRGGFEGNGPVDRERFRRRFDRGDVGTPDEDTL